MGKTMGCLCVKVEVAAWVAGTGGAAGGPMGV